MRTKLWFIGLIAFAGNVLATDGFDLHRRGSGAHKESETATISSYGKNDGHQTSTVMQSTMQGFDGSVDVRIGVGTARMRVPQQLLPPINAAKDDGWLDIHDLEITDRDITGYVKFNFANKPKVRIDRMAGEINISGSGGHFDGTCKAVDDTSERAF